MEKKELKKINYEFHKWKKELLILDGILSILVLMFVGIFKPDFVVIAAYFLTIPYLILSERKNLLFHLLISSVLAVFWMVIAKNNYLYNQKFVSILGINSFALFSWAIGLFGVYLVYSHYEHFFKFKGFVKKMLFFIMLYFPLLIFVETIAYNFFNIKNISAAAYNGLMICNCIHAPFWMKISYFLLGPIFFYVCYLLKLENPHYKLKR